jgi:hypothetical protein
VNLGRGVYCREFWTRAKAVLKELLGLCLPSAHHAARLSRRCQDGEVKRLPVWGWIVGIVGLGAVVGGAFAEGYLQDVLLQFGTVAVLLVPLLLVERSISARLRQRIDDYEAVRRAEAVLDMDDMWRDFGMKLGGKQKDGYLPVTVAFAIFPGILVLQLGF